MSVIRWLKSLRHKAYLAYYHCLPLKQNKVMLWANEFKLFGDSPKYIAKYLAAHDPGRYDIVWVLNREVPLPEELPEGVRVVRYFSIQYLKEISTAKVIVCNSRMGKAMAFHKRRGQYYIQTWHSSLRLKKIEGDVPQLNEDYVHNAKEDSAKMDLLLSGCMYSTKIFRRAFWYDGEILESGTPRCDPLIQKDPAVKTRVFAKYGIPQENKLLLYAPTFRDARTAELHGLDYAGCARALQASLGGKWATAFRLHPNINDRSACSDCIDMTDHPDMQELIASADCLITDYSSCMFDAAIAGVPCFLFAPDLTQYIQKERTLYFAPEDLPFPLTTSNAALAEEMTRFDPEKYHSQVAGFLEKIGSYEDGHAAERVCERIKLIVYGERK